MIIAIVGSLHFKEDLERQTVNYHKRGLAAQFDDGWERRCDFKAVVAANEEEAAANLRPQLARYLSHFQGYSFSLTDFEFTVRISNVADDEFWITPGSSSGTKYPIVEV